MLVRVDRHSTVTRAGAASERAHADDGAAQSVVVVGAHATLTAALVMALRQRGFPAATSTHPDALHGDGAQACVDVRPGDIVVLVVLGDDGPVRTTSIGRLVGQGCRVVVLMSGDQMRLLGECLRLGADAVAGDGMTFDRLAHTLLAIASGVPLLTSAERREIITATMQQPSGDEAGGRRFSDLTRREAQILCALVEGDSPKGIAQAAGISISTVRGHIQRVLSKLEVSSQREALAMARRAGWPQIDAA